MKTEELIGLLEEMAPAALAQGWDNVGLLVGDISKDVHKVYVALDAGSEVIDTAIKLNCDMIITHHPMIFSGIKGVTTDHFVGKRIYQMIACGINYYAMHTNFDIAVMGQLVCEKLALKITSPLEVTGEFKGNTAGIGTVSKLLKPMKLSDFARMVKETFELPDIRYYGAPDRVISTIAICPGSGKSMEAEVLASGADVFLTGDIDHHFGIDALEKGFAVIDAGHHGLEHVFVDYVADYLEEKTTLEIIKDINYSPFNVI